MGLIFLEDLVLFLTEEFEVVVQVEKVLLVSVGLGREGVGVGGCFLGCGSIELIQFFVVRYKSLAIF